jgi:hypothetical protein
MPGRWGWFRIPARAGDRPTIDIVNLVETLPGFPGV